MHVKSEIVNFNIYTEFSLYLLPFMSDRVMLDIQFSPFLKNLRWTVTLCCSFFVFLDHQLQWKKKLV